MRSCIFRVLAGILTVLGIWVLVTQGFGGLGICKSLSFCVFTLACGVFSVFGEAPAERLLMIVFGIRHSPDSQQVVTDDSRDDDDLADDAH